MSGGHFNYVHSKIDTEFFEIFLEDLKSGRYNHIDKETLNIMLDSIVFINYAKIAMKRMDWYLSGDDSEENYKSRLISELADTRSKAKSLPAIPFIEHILGRDYE